MPRGAFILFEGADRCGKTTQSTKLLQRLQQHNVRSELWRFPDRTTELGKMISAYLACKAELDDAAIHLLFSANRWEKRSQLLAALAEGTSLVVDRYAYSGVAYSAAKGNPLLTMDWCKACDTGLPAPDPVIYLAMSTEGSAQREGFGEERYEKAEMQARVKQCFEGLRQPDWCVVDASQSIEAIHEQIWAHAQAVVARCAAGQAPLRQLWDGAELALLAGQGGQRPLLGNITNSTTAAAARPQQDAAGSKGQQQQQPQEQQPQSS